MTPNSKLAIGLSLTASAGFVDAIAFLQLGGFFASFMSGNTTQLGIGLAGQTGITGQVLVLFPVTLIALFFMGAFTGTLIVRSMGKPGSLFVMGCVVATLVIVCLLRQWQTPYLQPVLLLAAAMGAQNAAVQPIGAARLGATYITGTLYNAAADLAGALRREIPKWRWFQHFSIWLALMIGAVFGGICHAFLGLNALYVPALVITGVMIAYAKSP